MVQSHPGTGQLSSTGTLYTASSHELLGENAVRLLVVSNWASVLTIGLSLVLQMSVVNQSAVTYSSMFENAPARTIPGRFTLWLKHVTISSASWYRNYVLARGALVVSVGTCPFHGL